jgi:hypothetical protein
MGGWQASTNREKRGKKVLLVFFWGGAYSDRKEGKVSTRIGQSRANVFARLLPPAATAEDLLRPTADGRRGLDGSVLTPAV